MIVDLIAPSRAGTDNWKSRVGSEFQRGASFSSGGFMCRNENKSERSQAIFNTPQTTSGNPANDVDKRAPESAGLIDEAKLRGTAVTLAAAVRSAGVTTAMT